LCKRRGKGTEVESATRSLSHPSKPYEDRSGVHSAGGIPSRGPDGEIVDSVTVEVAHRGITNERARLGIAR
jgi:hypothetical protein